MEKTEILLQTDGTLLERVVKERELDAGQQIIDSLTETVTRAVRDVADIPNWGRIHANVGPYDTVWTVPIRRIPLHARFRLVQGIMVPAFASSTDLELPLVWIAPAHLQPVFVVVTRYDEDNTLSLDGNWLFALDDKRRAYRLPLPNLHDDCCICTGRIGENWNTCQGAIIASLEQFEQSKWNSDLMKTIEESQQFFRFQPTNDTFETLPIQATQWTDLCEKVSTAISERIVL